MPTIHLLFFARARELAQRAEFDLHLPDKEITYGQLKQMIFEERFPQLKSIAPNCMLAIDQQYCEFLDSTIIKLRERAEVAVIPPVSGG